MSFGWSAGDIAIAVKIAYNIYEALDSCQGAAKEYREAASFLKELTRTLEPLKTFTAWKAYPEYGKDIRDQVNFIKVPVDEFLRIVNKYEPSLGAGARSGHHRHIFMKLKYRCFIQKEVLALRNNIESHMRVLDSLMQRLTLDVVYSTQQSLPGTLHLFFQETIRPEIIKILQNTLASGGYNQIPNPGMSSELYQSLLLRINDLKQIRSLNLLSRTDKGQKYLAGLTMLLQKLMERKYYLVLLYLGQFLKNLFLLLSQLVQPSRQLVPTLIAKFNLTFLDAVGSPSRVLPYEYFRNFKVLQGFVQEEFKGVPLIDRGRYLLLSMVNNHILDERNWQRYIAPGSTVAMSALVRTRQELDFSSMRDSQIELCPEPTCNGTWTRFKSQAWVTCPVCGRELFSAESETPRKDSGDDYFDMNDEDISIFKRIVHQFDGRLAGLQCTDCRLTFCRARDLNQPDGEKEARKKPKPFCTSCAVLVGDFESGAVFGGKGLGWKTDVRTNILALYRADDNWLGLAIEVPLGASNEEDGFGKCHFVERGDQFVAKPTDVLRINVKFPREITHVIRPLPKELALRFPDQPGDKMSLVEVSLLMDATVTVDGYGMTFASPGHPSHEWIRNPRAPIPDIGMSLFGLLDQAKFTLIVDYAPERLMKKWVPESLPPPFSYPYGFQHDWNVERYPALLNQNKGPHFEPACLGLCQRQRASCRDGPELGPRGMAAAPSLSRDRRREAVGILHPLRARRDQANLLRRPARNPGSQEAIRYGMASSVHQRLIDSRSPQTPQREEALKSTHCVEPTDLVLCLRGAKPSLNGAIKTFSDDASANTTLEQALLSSRFGWMCIETSYAAKASSRASARSMRMSTAPVFGKTTALALGTLGMAASHKVFATAPTNVATYNFATRLDDVTARVTQRYNDGKDTDDHIRRKLIVRIYKEIDDFEAFRNLLRDPGATDAAPPDSGAENPSGELHPDDSLELQALQGRIDDKEALARLRDVASGRITWEEYTAGETVAKDEIISLLDSVISAADILCATPSLSHTHRVASVWKNNKAKGIAVDEAAGMLRPDLYTAWGNTLIPCLLAGDDNQLGPVVLALEETDIGGNALNRLGEGAKISPLEWFKDPATGSKQKGDISVIIMSTNSFFGPGFTATQRRLNVMLSRQKSGLIIVGDINTVKHVKAKGGQGSKFKPKTMIIYGPNGEKTFTKAIMLQNVHSWMVQNERVIRIQARQAKDDNNGKDKDLRDEDGNAKGDKGKGKDAEDTLCSFFASLTV
ncbi:hypothetical protein EDB81DRAFT_934174 [Dactylonectria macrodidyma]|uniref:Ubiquitin-like domain-containing protein n=1 Tax=Dactylonectria macrodidyma TaxID=307937 RepID=A0A9P9J8H8_9HYPO|nr:hypothetical protein EDB81DRAFT_934174 [Dactylonectria macrodidyma]